MRQTGGLGLRKVLVVISAITMLSGACGDDDGSIGGTTATTDTTAGTSDGTDGTDGDGTGSADTTDGGQDTTDTSDTTEPAEPPVGDLELVLDECDYIPGGAIDGSDVLNVYVFVLLIGANELDERPRLVATEAGGLSFDRLVTPNNQAVTAMQFSLDASDLGRSIDFDVRLDPEDAIPETDEQNNDIAISLTIPGERREQIPLPCG